jgi:cobalamin synthase
MIHSYGLLHFHFVVVLVPTASVTTAAAPGNLHDTYSGENDQGKEENVANKSTKLVVLPVMMAPLMPMVPLPAFSVSVILLIFIFVFVFLFHVWILRHLFHYCWVWMDHNNSFLNFFASHHF